MRYYVDFDKTSKILLHGDKSIIQGDDTLPVQVYDVAQIMNLKQSKSQNHLIQTPLTLSLQVLLEIHLKL